MRGAKKEVAGRRESKKVARLDREKEQQEAALTLQRLSRVRAAKIEADERRKRKEAAVRVGDRFSVRKLLRMLPCLDCDSLVLGMLFRSRGTKYQGTSEQSKTSARTFFSRSKQEFEMACWTVFHTWSGFALSFRAGCGGC